MSTITIEVATPNVACMVTYTPKGSGKRETIVLTCDDVEATLRTVADLLDEGALDVIIEPMLADEDE